MADETHVQVGGEEIRITSPDRVVFPSQGWTKRDVVEHFVTVAEGALRGIFGRPTMLKRYMQDVDHDPVYHKRAAANTPFETVPIVFPSQRPGIMNVPRTRGRRPPAGATRLPRLPPVAITRRGHRPSRRVAASTSIRPPGFGFDACEKGRGRSQELLDEIGLVGWPKTSGSRGIHVYIRIEPDLGFHPDQAGGACLRPRVGAAHARPGDDEVVERGAPRACSSTSTRTPATRRSRRPTGSAPPGLSPPRSAGRNSTTSTSRTSRSIGSATATAAWATSLLGSTKAPGRIDLLLEWMARDEETGDRRCTMAPDVPQDARRASSGATIEAAHGGLNPSVRRPGDGDGSSRWTPGLRKGTGSASGNRLRPPRVTDIVQRPAAPSGPSGRIPQRTSRPPSVSTSCPK